jgi:regulatory protein
MPPDASPRPSAAADPVPPGTEGDATQAPDPARALEDALALAYRHLGRRDRSEAQLRSHLRGRGVGDDTIEQCLCELREQGYVDDARFAQRFAEDRRALDGWGTERIHRSLRGQGIPEELARQALPDGRDELTAAVELLASRLRDPPADERARARALGLLARRGYDIDLAYEAVRAFERDGARRR